ncbi:relA-associated inhibitor isoform X4 [Lissotriton helveticus]
MVQTFTGSGGPKLSRYGSMHSLVMPNHMRTTVWSKLLSWKTSTVEALDRNFRKMAGEQMSGSQSMMDLNFQSFAAQNIDEKQMELDMAAAKMDNLTKELESIWSNNSRSATSPVPGKDSRYNAGTLDSQDQKKLSLSSTSSLSPSLSQPPTRKIMSSNGGENYVPSLSRPGPLPPSLSIPVSTHNLPLGSPVQLSPLPVKNTLSRSVSPCPRVYLQPDPKPLVDRPLSPRPMSNSPTYESLTVSQPGRSSSPRPLHMRPIAPVDHNAALRPAVGSLYDCLPYSGQPGRIASPRPISTPTVIPVVQQAFFGERMPAPRPTVHQGYENTQVFGSTLNSGLSAFAPFLSPGGDPNASFRAQTVPMSGPWRESSLDAAAVSSKDDLYGQNSFSTLPRNYKYNPATGDRRIDPSVWRSHSGAVPGTLPRNWQAQQPISRIPIPPSSPQGGLPKQQKPIPLSMIFRLQNAFWEQRTPYSMGNIQGPPGSPTLGKLQQSQPHTAQAQSHVRSWSTSDGSGKVSTLERAQELQRMPSGLPEAGELEPELSILLPTSDSQIEEVPRPLSPSRLQPILPPEAQKMPEMDEIRRVLADIPRPLKRRGSMEQSVAVPQPASKKQYQQIMSRLFRRSTPKETVSLVGEGAPQMEMPVIIEGSETKVGATIAQERSPSPSSPAVLIAPTTPISKAPSQEIRSVLKKHSSPKKTRSRRARLNPLVLLLDAALTGELDVVQQAVKEMNDPSQANDEGITALHNAICGANYEIVDFLIDIGVNVNSPDSHGWTPLHCAASCNDTNICMALVKHGAAIFAMTFSDGTMPVEKCDPYRDGYKECSSYLSDVEQSMGLVNNGIVYALWDHITEERDELSFRQGDTVTILRRDEQDEPEWWWASLYGREGYIPKNYFGLFPRVRAHRSP